MARRPTEKQKKFIEGKLQGKTSRKAALDAGYSVHTADNANAEILDRAGTQSYKEKFLELLHKTITPDKLVKVYNEALNASKTDVIGTEHPDHKVRLESAKQINQMDEVLPGDVDLRGLTINVTNYSDKV